MNNIKLVVDEKMSGRKLRDILRRDMKLSANLLTKLKKTGGILLNGNIAITSYIVNAGDEICINFPKEEKSNIPATDIPLEVVYEDEHIVAVNKPKDMPTHPSIGNYYNTLGNACMYYYRDVNFVFRPVNRLDRDTTGIVIIAKNAITSYLLSEQMKQGGFKKTYYAITEGIPNPKNAIIDVPIARESESIIKRKISPLGQRAITEYNVLKTHENLALLRINLHTGRTHQIRVHMAHIGTPLLYDYMYGTEVSGETLFLHCGEVEFIHPFTEEKVHLVCNYKFPYFE